MGCTLSEPITTKSSETLNDDNYLVGSSCMQGWRDTMEDTHVHILSLPNDPGTSFYGVFDGHCGKPSAEYVSKHLLDYIIKTNEYKEGKIIEAMQQGFLQLDETMKSDPDLIKRSGTTAVTCLIKDNILYCANAGDSRAVASVCGEALPLSRDHKPTMFDEQKRIKNAGGYVCNKRVLGDLALSRALGDFNYKQNKDKKPEEQMVTAFPEVQKHIITEDWEFIILACDGIWDCMTNSEVIEFIRNHIASLKNFDETFHPNEICEKLFDHNLAPNLDNQPIGCDNMTAVLVCLLHGKPSSFFQLQCQRPPKNPTVGMGSERKKLKITDDEEEIKYVDYSENGKDSEDEDSKDQKNSDKED